MGPAVEILLVEDNRDHVELTLRAFRKVNLDNKVHVARDGVEALDFIYGTGEHEGRHGHYQLGAVILDLKLPRVSGFDVLAKIKSDECTRHIPVVILTSSQQEQDRGECYRLGANSYIVKPLSFEKLTEVVAQIATYWLLVNERLY